MKCHLSCYRIFSFMPESAYRKCEGNVLEISCVLALGNVPEILSYAAPEKVKMSKFPDVGNVHNYIASYHEQEM